MATELGQAYVQIIPSAKGISGNIVKEMGGDVDSAADSLGSRFGQKLVGAVKGVIAAAGIGKFMADSISAGGALEQNLGGTEAVFGNFSSSIQKSATQAYKNMGLSASDYMSTANKMGSLFQGSGLTQQRSLDLTSKAMQRAADVASVMGIDTTWAMESIAGAAKGNYTMMDNLGVAMNATTLQAYALEKGINFDWNTATNAQKAELAMQMFFDRTSQYAGNFARESEDTLVGSMDSVKASFSDVLGNLALGNDIQPSLEALGSSVSNFLLNNLIPMVKNIVSGIPDVVVGFITAAAPRFAEAGSQLLESFGISMSDFTGVASQVATNISPVIESIKNAFGSLPLLFTELKTAVGDVASTIGENLAQLDFSGISALADAIIPALVAGFQTFWTIVKPAVEGVVESFRNLWNALQPLFTTIASVLQPALEVFGAFLGGVFKGVLEAVKLAFDGITFVVQLLQPVIDFLGQVFQKLSPFIQAVAEKVGELIGFFGNLGGAAGSLKELIHNAWTNISNIITGAKNIISGAIDGIKGFFQAVAEKGMSIKNILSTAWDGIKNAVSSAKNLISGAIDGIKGFFQAAADKGNALRDTLKGAWDAITGKITEAKEKISGIIDGVKNIFNSLGNINLLSIGKGIMDSFLDGLKSAWEGVKNFVGGIAGWIREHKGPPSYDRRLLIPAGNAIMAGFNEGLQENFRDVKKTVNGMAGALMEDVQGALPDVTQSVSMQANRGTGEMASLVGETLKEKEQAEKGNTPLYLNLSLGGQSFRAFVEDITRAQEQEVNLRLRYE